MVELGELDATFRKSDIAALKSFLTSDRDIYRLPYARKNTSKPRQTVFFASVNDESFLSDQTGNRRYWTIDCEAIDYEHGIDMQQFWAEVKAIYDRGESWFLDKNQMVELNEHNKEFTAIDPIVEKIESKLDWSASDHKWDWKTSTDVAEMVGVFNPSKGDIVRVGLYLKKEKGVVVKKTNGVIRRYVPPKLNDFMG
jgi:putative DNA primase/helicase